MVSESARSGISYQQYLKYSQYPLFYLEYHISDISKSDTIFAINIDKPLRQSKQPISRKVVFSRKRWMKTTEWLPNSNSREVVKGPQVQVKDPVPVEV